MICSRSNDFYLEANSYIYLYTKIFLVVDHVTNTENVIFYLIFTCSQNYWVSLIFGEFFKISNIIILFTYSYLFPWLGYCSNLVNINIFFQSSRLIKCSALNETKSDNDQLKRLQVTL